MIQPKKKPCDGEDCKGELQYIWKADGRQKFCKSCWLKKTAATRDFTVEQAEKPVKPVEPKVKKRINRMSGKMQKLLSGYRRLRVIFFQDSKNCTCKAGLAGC